MRETIGLDSALETSKPNPMTHISSKPTTLNRTYGAIFIKTTYAKLYPKLKDLER